MPAIEAHNCGLRVPGEFEETSSASGLPASITGKTASTASLLECQAVPPDRSQIRKSSRSGLGEEQTFRDDD
jgi:hypothetical protein